jgi:hypothetical protein
MSEQDFDEDLELETVSLQDLEYEREVDLTESPEEGFEDFYLPPEKPLRF